MFDPSKHGLDARFVFQALTPVVIGADVAPDFLQSDELTTKGETLKGEISHLVFQPLSFCRRSLVTC